MKLQPMPTPTITGPSNGGSITLRPIFGTGPAGAPSTVPGPAGAPGGSDAATAGWITGGTLTPAALSASIDARAVTPVDEVGAPITGGARIIFNSEGFPLDIVLEA